MRIGEPVFTKIPTAGNLDEYTPAAAIRTIGIPFAWAAMSENKLDFPMSIEPPTTAAATAAPLLLGRRSTSRPYFWKMPCCIAQTVPRMSSSAADATRRGVSAAGVCATADAACRPNAAPSAMNPRREW